MQSGTNTKAIYRNVVGGKSMFNFRLINMPDGSQVIDSRLKTPINALTPSQMVEYRKMEVILYQLERLKRKQKREQQKELKKNRSIFYRLREAIV